MRVGTSLTMLLLYSGFRIIPMRVGTSNTQLINCCKYKDHPHACGDKPNNQGLRFHFQGSSPCVWGQADTIRHCLL